MKSVGGPNLLIYLVLAFGGAMFIGNLLALVRPPSKISGSKKTASQQTAKNPSSVGGKKTPPSTTIPTPDLPTAPRRRTLMMMAIGGVVSLWAIATLLSH
jgi:hypothetical protein